MKRIIMVDDGTGYQAKYVLEEEYNGFGIYKEKTPSGYFVNQSWVITDDKKLVICQSYNDMCKEELLDAIDSYKETGKFGLKLLQKGTDTLIVHSSGTCM